MTWLRQQLQVMLLAPGGPEPRAELCVCGQCGRRTCAREPLALAMVLDRGDGVPVPAAPVLVLCRRCFVELAADLDQIARRAVLQNDYAGAVQQLQQRSARARAGPRREEGEG